MDFQLPPEARDLIPEIRSFLEEKVIPLESRAGLRDAHDFLKDAALEDLRAEARARGLWALQMPESLGGRGLSRVAMAACYEELGRALFGPIACNCAAPDDGNMLLLDKVATPAQRERWLAPIVAGKVRSTFAMTEPMPGAGSDPGAMRTQAVREGDHWRVSGRKWFITGGEGARHIVLIARTSDDPRKGLTAFMVDAEMAGWTVERRIPIMGPEEPGGHCEIAIDDLRVPDENRLLEVGDGLKVTQIRLGTARLTHCMRWLGMARRALEIAGDYISERESFGIKLKDHEGVQWMLGEAAMDIQIGRLLTMRAAARLDSGDFARKEVSMAKVQVADALHKAVDTAIQLCGAKGYSKDTPLEWMYRYARQARLVDGASEVHKMVLARSVLSEGLDFWSWP